MMQVGVVEVQVGVVGRVDGIDGGSRRYRLSGRKAG